MRISLNQHILALLRLVIAISRTLHNQLSVDIMKLVQIVYLMIIAAASAAAKPANGSPEQTTTSTVTIIPT
ncbi:hypothetical protein BDR03DRAFT_1013131 [Suillus americanus]|nr:hypothetical protein BDR03DRAFT_1013131 [Suillus americanus]